MTLIDRTLTVSTTPLRLENNNNECTLHFPSFKTGASP